jgi:hypothetical protein
LRQHLRPPPADACHLAQLHASRCCVSSWSSSNSVSTFPPLARRSNGAAGKAPRANPRQSVPPATSAMTSRSWPAGMPLMSAPGQQHCIVSSSNHSSKSWLCISAFYWSGTRNVKRVLRTGLDPSQASKIPPPHRPPEKAPETASRNSAGAGSLARCLCSPVLVVSSVGWQVGAWRGNGVRGGEKKKKKTWALLRR